MAKFLSIDGVGRLLANIANKYSQIGHKHSYEDISDGPKIPTHMSELINDKGYINTDVNTTYQLELDDDGSIVLTGSDGSFDKVKPTGLVQVDGALSEDSANPVENRVIANALKDLVPNTRTINGLSLAEDINLTAEMFGAEHAGAAEEKIGAHNEDTNAHYDLRMGLQALNARLSMIADSDDSTLDQLSEIVKYAKDNTDLIYSITTQKVNVDDIVDNLTTVAASKPLSARQGTIIASKMDELEDHMMRKTDVQIITWEADD